MIFFPSPLLFSKHVLSFRLHHETSSLLRRTIKRDHLFFHYRHLSSSYSFPCARKRNYIIIGIVSSYPRHRHRTLIPTISIHPSPHHTSHYIKRSIPPPCVPT